MNKPLIVVFALLGLAALPACGSKSDSGSSCVPTSDFGNASAACKSCVESSCSSEYSALCSAGCTSSNASSSACTQAASNIGTCIESKCASACEDSSSSGGSSSNGTAGTTSTSGGTDNSSGGTVSNNGGSDSSSAGSDNTSGGTGNSAGSSSASAGAGGAGTPTAPNCVTLETCCGTLPDNAKGACLQAAGFNNDGPCKNLLTAYQNGGQCTGKGGTDGNHVVCYLSAMGLCTKTYVPANLVSTYQSGCQGEGGTTPDVCPTDTLVGCCTIGSGEAASESCYYTALGTTPMASDCTQMSGTWSTTP